MIKKAGIISLVLALAMFIGMLPPFEKTAMAASDLSMVRVLLSTGNATTINAAVKGDYFIQETGVSFSSGTLTVSVSSGKINVSHSKSGQLYSGSSCTVMRKSYQPSAGSISMVAGGVTRTYLGNFTFKISSGSIRVINTVPLQHYLYGVVAFEMSNAFPLEALKAQAVAAKCYVFSGLMPSSDYDIGDTASDQVYKGYNSSYTAVINAVDATFDIWMYLGNNILCSYFAASNGGYTILPSDSWTGTNRYIWDGAYARTEDPYDIANPLTVQEVIVFPAAGDSGGMTPVLSNFMRARATQILQANRTIASNAGVVFINSVDNVVSRSTTTAEIAMTVTVRNADGTDTVTNFAYTEDFAWLVANGVFTKPQSLRLYTVTPVSGGWQVRRGRYGHGVGLSQRGAEQMANSGWRYDKILNFYYPGATLKSMGLAMPADPVMPTNPTDTGTAAPGSTTVTSYGEVTSSTLNLRQAPNTSAKVLASLKKGAKIDIYGFADGSNTWYYGTSGGKTGYMSAQYVKITGYPAATSSGDNATVPPAGSVTSGSGLINTEGIFLRKTASTKESPVAKLPKNLPITITGEEGDYYAVTFVSGTTFTGFVEKQYVSVTSSNTSGSSSSGTQTQTGTTSGNVNFRKGPGISYSIIKQLKKGTALTIHSYSGGWYEVTVDGTRGYLSGDYVKVNTSSSDSSQSSSNSSGTIVYTGAVVNDKVYLRSTPDTSTSSNILGEYPVGTQLTVFHTENSFYKVSVGSLEGYMHINYVQITGEQVINSTSAAGKTTAKVNLRNGPSTSGTKVLQVVSSNTAITVLSSEGDWYKVQVGNTTGYMVKRYVSVSGTVSSGSSSSGKSGITTGNVNFRSSQSTSKSSNIIRTLSKGTALTINSKSGSWYNVTVNGTTGYIYASYVKET